jgi:hypothetical protein
MLLYLFVFSFCMMNYYNATWGILEVKIGVNEQSATVEFLSPVPNNPGPTSELYGGLYSIQIPQRDGDSYCVSQVNPGFIERRRLNDYPILLTSSMPPDRQQKVFAALAQYSSEN